MNRRKARENAFIAFFESSFGTPAADIIAESRDVDETYRLDDFGTKLLTLYEEHAGEIDALVEPKLKGWKITRLPRVSLAILRLSVTEMFYGSPDMDSVIINEAVEIAKKYGDESDYQFINGVLGNISREKPALADESAGVEAAKE